MKNLYHGIFTFLKSVKGSLDDQIILHIKTKWVLLALFSERLLMKLLVLVQYFIKLS